MTPPDSDIVLNFISSDAVLHAATVEPGAVDVQLQVFGAAAVFLPTITRFATAEPVPIESIAVIPELIQSTASIFHPTLEREGQGTVPRLGHKKTASGGGGLAFKGGGSLRLRRASGPQRPIRP